MNDDKNRKQPAAVVTVEGIGSYQVPTGRNLRETLRSEGVYVDGTCSDNGTCGRCVVRVVSGDAGKPTLQEAGLLGERSADHEHRLACRVIVNGDLNISIDQERMLEVDLTGRWKEVWGSPLWRPDLISTDGTGFGVAVDMGTTSIVAALFDMSHTRPLDIKSAPNPHLPWGEDIISRMDAADADSALVPRFSELIWTTVGELIRSLCLRSGVSIGRVTRVTAVGNSAVHHLSLGLPGKTLLLPPYVPFDGAARTDRALDLPFNMGLGRDAKVYFPPLVGGYAGSDALASTLAVKNTGVKIGALIDVGTNTEIAVWNGDEILVATAPSGPAFEGGHIKSGMRAVEGAVWRVEIKEGTLLTEVIGEGTAKGVCGTGIVDAIASMLRSGIVDSTGLIVEGSHPRVKDGKFVIGGEDARENDLEKNSVALKGEDVATVQKAKAAIAATFQLLLKSIGLDKRDLEQVYLAGAFGSRLNLANAVRIGLLPELPPDRYVLAGNTAMLGASMILLSEKAKFEGEKLVEKTIHHSVAGDPDFEDLFIDNLYFT
ncbi:MAG: ASKHA domain-containing protein [bacterium]|nr:ASKHA domain-containing protein [bacterium]MDT8366937.1 ASKHA domain-containing protein [bacterium]